MKRSLSNYLLLALCMLCSAVSISAETFTQRARRVVWEEICAYKAPIAVALGLGVAYLYWKDQRAQEQSLHAAAKATQSTDILLRCLKAGVNVHHQDPMDMNKTALMQAVEHNNSTAVHWLLEYKAGEGLGLKDIVGSDLSWYLQRPMTSSTIVGRLRPILKK